MWKLLTKNPVTICFLLVCATAVFVHPATAQIEKLGYLRISAQYPSQIPRSYVFQVNLTVAYAFRDYYEISAAVYQGATGSLGSPLWQGQPESLAGVGERTYGVQLKSPDQEGQWLVTGYAFFHNASSSVYFTDEERGPGFVEMSIKVADNAKLSLRTTHGNMPVSVDGAPFTTDQNGVLVREVKVLALHSIEAPRNVSITSDWRALFLSWNGTDHGNPKTLLVSSDLSLTADYEDEFRLDLVSEVPQVSGTGWYMAGTVANFSAPLLVTQEGMAGLVGIRWKFTGWSGDIESTDPSESLVMDRPHRVVANWVTDYTQLFFLLIGAAVLVVGAAGAFVALRIARKPPKEPLEEPAAKEASAAPVAPPAPAVRKFCRHCGATNDPEARFCSKCGKSQVNSN